MDNSEEVTVPTNLKVYQYFNNYQAKGKKKQHQGLLYHMHNFIILTAGLPPLYSATFLKGEKKRARISPLLIPTAVVFCVVFPLVLS